MTKGPHKDSLRKGEPNKWVVEDIIERIRAEVNRLKGICTAQIKANPGQTFPFVMEMTGYDKLLSVLSDLEKEEKPMNQDEDFRGEMREWVELMVAASFPEQDNDFISEEDCRSVIKQTARHFYELGCRRTAEKYDEIEYKRQRADVCEGLEEEAVSYCFDNGLNLSPMVATDFARHFARWGAEHCGDTTKKMKTPVSDDLEKSARLYAIPHYMRDVDVNYLEEYSYDKIAEDAFIAGAQWKKEQMMKGAVEGEVVKDINNRLAVTAKNVNLDKFKFGDKVRIIIKED